MGLEEPEVDLARAKQDMIGLRFENEGCQVIIRSVADLVDNCLNVRVGSNIPNFDHFVGAKRDQMVSLLVDCQVLHRGVVTVQVRENTECEGVPHNDVPLFTAGSNETMSVTVHERVDTFLVQVECFIFVRQLIDVVNVDQSIQRGREDVV